MLDGSYTVFPSWALKGMVVIQFSRTVILQRWCIAIVMKITPPNSIVQIFTTLHFLTQPDTQKYWPMHKRHTMGWVLRRHCHQAYRYICVGQKFSLFTASETVFFQVGVY